MTDADFLMDCDVAAAFDHVSYHVIFGAVSGMEVPPVVAAAWLREDKGSEAVPQGASCAADLVQHCTFRQ